MPVRLTLACFVLFLSWLLGIVNPGAWLAEMETKPVVLHVGVNIGWLPANHTVPTDLHMARLLRACSQPSLEARIAAVKSAQKMEQAVVVAAASAPAPPTTATQPTPAEESMPAPAPAAETPAPAAESSAEPPAPAAEPPAVPAILLSSATTDNEIYDNIGKQPELPEPATPSVALTVSNATDIYDNIAYNGSVQSEVPVEKEEAVSKVPAEKKEEEPVATTIYHVPAEIAVS